PEIAQRLVEVLAMAAAAPAVGALANVLDPFAALEQEAPALVGDRVHLTALVLGHGHAAHVLEHLERGVEHARAGRVATAEALLDATDELVAVAGLLLKEVQDHVLEVALLEHALAPPLAPVPV